VCSINDVVIYYFISKEVDIIPNGSTIEVTKHNRMKYLDALAQYKLNTRVSAEIEAFIKGITTLILDSSL
jgi:ubiquitin-protein ligase E3 C